MKTKGAYPTMTTIKISFARLFQCIDFIRDKRHMSVKEFCEQIHTTPKTYKKWLAGNTKSFNLDHIRAICQTLMIPQTEAWLRIFEPDLMDEAKAQPEEMRTA